MGKPIHEPWYVQLMYVLGLWTFSDGSKDQVPWKVESGYTTARKTIAELLSWIGFIFAAVWVLWSLQTDLTNNTADWFPRSGAVLVAASVFVEIFRVDGPFTTPNHMTPRLHNLRSIVQWLGYFCALLGTFIWSYGDKWIG